MTTCWIVTEGMAGTENQCIGIAEALGIACTVKRIGLRQPWKLLSPWLGFECARAFTGDALSPPWPDLLIAAGRKSIAASRYIKRESGGTVFTVQVQDPRIVPRHFDLVAVPMHDPARGDNVVVTQATPNRITAASLSRARDEFAALLSPLPAPRAAVMIGGGMSESAFAGIIQQVKELSAQGFSLMITASRRTGEANARMLHDALAGLPRTVFWKGAGPNPYTGFLAWADYIIVTADSASMLSEAATTGKPVYIATAESGSKRLNMLCNRLIENGIARQLKGVPEAYSYHPLADAALVADAIRKRMGKRIK